MKNKTIAKTGKRGFSLVEAIVACFILVMIAVGISSAIAYSTSATSKANVETDDSVQEKELLNAIIAVLSSGTYTGTQTREDESLHLTEDNETALLKSVGFYTDAGEIAPKWSGYAITITPADGAGFYILLRTPEGKNINAYASNTEGIFYVD